jgi:hypothetical protein
MIGGSSKVILNIRKLYSLLSVHPFILLLYIVISVYYLFNYIHNKLLRFNFAMPGCSTIGTPTITKNQS